MTPTNTPMTTFTKIVFWFVAVNALAGAGALILFPNQTNTLFFWEITPPINAALFGALYLGGAAIVGFLTYRGAWEPARFLIPVLVSAGILISVITFVHLDKFTPGFKLIYWLVVYVGAPLLAIGIYIQQERNGASWRVTTPIASTTRTTALAVGGLLLAAGIVLLIWPGLIVVNWPWPTGILMVRIFTAWFSAFGVGLLWFGIEQEWERLHHIANLMIAAALFDLLMLLIHRSDVTTVGLSVWLYAIHLAAFGVLGALMHWWQWRAT